MGKGKHDPIYSIVRQVGIDSISPTFVCDVVQRLTSFGYPPKKEDEWLIAFQIRKVMEDICNECNVKELPQGLVHNAVEQVLGVFLLVLKQMGRLEVDGTVGELVQKVQTGDTSVWFSVDSSLSDEAQLDTVLHHLASSGKEIYSCYRKLRW